MAVIEPQEAKTIEFNEKEFSIEWYSGTGAGGQHRNKHQNSARITHLASGIVATAQTRSRVSSLEEAKASILAKLNSGLSTEERQRASIVRQEQTGSGMRGDKSRTYRFQEDNVKDHITGKSATISKVMAGNFNLLW